MTPSNTPRTIRISDFTYNLPDDRIARYPLPERDASKLLIYNNGKIADDSYRHVASHLPNDALLVFNNTKVIEARIRFTKPSGGTIEVFLLEPVTNGQAFEQALQIHGAAEWNCLVGGASKWKKGMILEKKLDNGHQLRASITAQLQDRFRVRLEWQPENISFGEILHEAGIIPLPPYLKRETEASDKERYQTIYASKEGSVAAPTAGLHFTERIFADLSAKGIEHVHVTLHVGAGTFKPVKSETMSGHDMHAEFMEVSRSTLEKLRITGKVYAVGTTSMRTLESAYWMGVKCMRNPNIDAEALEMQQWELYDGLMHNMPPPADAIQALLNYMDNHQLETILCKTQLLVAPGYKRGIVSGLLTNFHQPQSTLLLLVAAFTGDDWKRIYNHALQNEYRFLSFGDGMLIV